MEDKTTEVNKDKVQTEQQEKQTEDTNKKTEEQTENTNKSNNIKETEETNNTGSNVEENQQQPEEKDESNISDLVNDEITEIEKYLDKLDNKEDIKLYIDLVDKWMSPDKAYDALQKIVEKEGSKTEQEETPKKEPKEVKSIDDILEKYF